MAQTAPAEASAAQVRDRSWVYFDGRVCRYDEARVGLMTHGLHYGTGCFEGIRAYWDEAAEQLWTFRMPEHFDRLRNSGRILRMQLPLSTPQLCEITLDLLRRNKFRSDVYI
ncbi:MAG: branched chain amino acid aminotransferase, partial [Candidatus Dormibacteraeota bacterium]|nr:branched chain amino acid aminotransferase [Candidatus Dormibacteraeota bacterium]